MHELWHLEHLHWERMVVSEQYDSEEDACDEEDDTDQDHNESDNDEV